MGNTPPRHFLDLHHFSPTDLRQMLALAHATLPNGEKANAPLLAGKIMAGIFEKPSTRTRVSFMVAMKQLGGDFIELSPNNSQMGRGESIEDTARLLSRYVDVIMIRTDAEEKLLRLADHATVPVINGLTDNSHPCQLLADVMTFEQHRGPITGKTITWCGDGNNVATSWVHAAVTFGFRLNLAIPKALDLPDSVMAWATAQKGNIHLYRDMAPALENSDCVVTDTRVSMGENQNEQRHNLLAPFQVTEATMQLAKPSAIFMHCLPAHRGEEVTAAVIDGPQSVVFDEAENRLHAQKGILLWCLG